MRAAFLFALIYYSKLQKMIERLRRIWLPIAGSVSSMSVSAAENIKHTPQLMENPTQFLIAEHPMLYYFLIGIAGALGGLFVKITWGLAKRRFPKLLNGIDK